MLSPSLIDCFPAALCRDLQNCRAAVPRASAASRCQKEDAWLRGGGLAMLLDCWKIEILKGKRGIEQKKSKEEEEEKKGAQR